ncbi:hypothetical protein [Geothrix alkalitolerans]|uniref:hypothetical protein n=1 Tax=Geothrix alkalitolerans TaxID=2922724 RepID=UPI001FAFBB4D|nr:hypothetical protein [Geothrix alkalitolerans]
MSPSESNFEQELTRRVDEVLHYIWDPIHVSGIPEARDEYDSYVQPVVRLLLSGATEQVIAEFLARITSETIGMSTNLKQENEASEALTNWYQVLRERNA